MSSVLHLYPSYQKTSLKNPTLFLKLLKSREDFCFQFGFLSSLPNDFKNHTDWGLSVKIHGWKRNFVKVWIGSPKTPATWLPPKLESMIFRTKKNGVKNSGSKRTLDLSSGLGRFLLAECLTFEAGESVHWKKKPPTLEKMGRSSVIFFN